MGGWGGLLIVIVAMVAPILPPAVEMPRLQGRPGRTGLSRCRVVERFECGVIYLVVSICISIIPILPQDIPSLTTISYRSWVREKQIQSLGLSFLNLGFRVRSLMFRHRNCLEPLKPNAARGFCRRACGFLSGMIPG